MAVTSKGDLGRFSANTQGHTFVATGATTVNVAYPQLTANSVVLIELLTVGGTPAAKPYLITKTPGTGFGVRAAAGDTSTYLYRVI
jgi:hypothetical protein